MKTWKITMPFVLAASAFLWMGCASGSDSEDGTPDANLTIEKPTMENIAGTWENTFSEQIYSELESSIPKSSSFGGAAPVASIASKGTKSTTSSIVFHADGTFTQIDKIVKDYTDNSVDSDSTLYTAFKGTVSVSDATVTLVFTGKIISSVEISDLSAESWSAYSFTEKFPAIIIGGKLYLDGVFTRTGAGTELAGEWTCVTSSSESSYESEKMIYTFSGSSFSAKNQGRDSAEGTWIDGTDASGTFSLTGGTTLSISSGEMTMSFSVLVAGDYFVLKSEKGYSRK